MNQKKSGKDSSTTPTVFEHVDIDVIPEISPNQGTANTPAPEGSEPVIEPLNPTAYQDPALMSDDECLSLSMMVWNMPSMIYGQHLERTEAQVRPFARELCIYCNNKGINPRDYLFDEFGLLLATLVIGGGLWKEQKAHKRNNKPAASDGVQKTKKSVKNVGLGVHDVVSGEEHKPVVEQRETNPAHGSGGDNLPDEVPFTDTHGGKVVKTVTAWSGHDDAIETVAGTEVFDFIPHDPRKAEIPEELNNYEEV